MAGQAQGAEVLEVALAAAFGYRADVVGIPERAARGDGLHAIEVEAGDAGFAAGTLERGVDGDGIGVAEGADAVVAGEDAIAEVAGIGAEAMLVHAVVRAEGAAAFGENFEIAPAAQGEAVGSEGQLGGLDAAAGKGAGDEHTKFKDRAPRDAAEVAAG